MRRRSCTLTLLLALGLPTAIAAQEPRVERVRFEPGASSTTIKDRIQGNETVHYVVGASAGQTMDVTLETGHGATYFNVLPPGYEPGRDTAAFAGETGGSHYSGALAHDGEARIEVYMMRSAARRDEVADYTLTIAIRGEPNPDAPPLPSGPWPLDTDASGELPCAVGGTSFERGAFDLACSFRVKRNAYGATIWAVPPGEARPLGELEFGDLRTLYFEGTQPGLEGGAELKDSWSTSDGGEIRWDRHEDTWVVNIGAGDERYWIPDAVIWGG